MVCLKMHDDLGHKMINRRTNDYEEPKQEEDSKLDRNMDHVIFTMQMCSRHLSAAS